MCDKDLSLTSHISHPVSLRLLDILPVPVNYCSVFVPQKLLDSIVEHESICEFITGNLLESNEIPLTDCIQYLGTEKVHTQHKSHLQPAALVC